MDLLDADLSGPLPDDFDRRTPASELLGPDDFTGVNPRLLVSPEDRDFDLFIERQGRMCLYLAAHKPFRRAELEKLLSNNWHKLYVRRQDKEAFLRFTEARILELVMRMEMPLPKRAALLYDMAATVIKDVLEEPSSEAQIRRAVRLADRIQQFIVHSPPRSLVTLVTMTRFESYLNTHAINCCIFGIGVGFTLGESGDRLHALGTGCLLMDLGMTTVPPAVREKRGKLTADEWALVRRHPLEGERLLRAAGGLPNEEAFYPVLQHHERLDGSGYPTGLVGDEIHPFGRIAAMVDTYDAMTTQRPYAGALKTFPALKTIRDEMRGKVDPEVFRQFVLLLNEPG